MGKFWRYGKRGNYFGAVQSLSRVDGETEGEGGKEADGDGEEGACEEDFLEVGAFEAIVLGYEGHVVGEVGSVRSLGFHVSFDSVGFFRAVECDGQLEDSTGNFGAA